MSKLFNTENMIDIRCIELSGFVSALQALHLPYGIEGKSYTKMAIVKEKDGYTGNWTIKPTDHDISLIKALIHRGDEHAKVLRGVNAYLEINAPRYWWVEFDTYRIGREQLASESTMHMQGKGMSEEDLIYMKSRLPEGTMQKRVQMISYQTLRRMYLQRYNHRLPEWREFCQWIINNLPYSWMIYDAERENN